MRNGRGRKVRPLLRSSSTVTRQKVIYPRGGRAAFESMVVEFAPAGESGWHLHPYPAYAYVLQGTLHVELEGGRHHTIREGRATLEVTNTWHNARNNGRKPLKLLMVYAGIRGKPNLIRPTARKKRTN